MQESDKSMKMPWMKFYTRDWRSDDGLQICDLEAKGAWIEMICIMAQSENYGYLEHNGEAHTDDALCRLIGTDKDTLARCIATLEANRVFSRDDRGVIYSRRMVDDRAKHDAAVASGRRGGNPNLNKDTRNKNTESRESLRDTLKGEVKADTFDAFWKAYPRKVGKAAARKAWQKAKPDLDKCLATLAWQVKSGDWTKEGGQFVPHAATWINQGRWDDEPKAPTTPQQPHYDRSVPSFREWKEAGGE